MSISNDFVQQGRYANETGFAFGSAFTIVGERWKFCPSCGTKLGDGWKYCADCGTQVGHIAAPFVIPMPTYPWSPTITPFPHPYGPTWQIPIGGTCSLPNMAGNTYTVRGDEQMTYTS
jgi:hypothetical protein